MVALILQWLWSSQPPHSPYGIAPYPGNSSRLLVADWGSNRTVVMQVDWTTGQLKMERNLTKYWPVFLNGHTDFENDRVPYPFRLAASKDNLAVISMVCCKTWQVKEIHKFNISIWSCFQAPLLALRLFSIHSGELTRTVKQLEDGRTVGSRFTCWTGQLLLVFYWVKWVS